MTRGNIADYDCLNTFRKYYGLRPESNVHDRFFVAYSNAKCTFQLVAIAKFLNSANSECFTGHYFRRLSASLLTDANADIYTLYRHGGLKSVTVTENYVETSIEKRN